MRKRKSLKIVKPVCMEVGEIYILCRVDTPIDSEILCDIGF